MLHATSVRFAVFLFLWLFLPFPSVSFGQGCVESNRKEFFPGANIRHGGQGRNRESSSISRWNAIGKNTSTRRGTVMINTKHFSRFSLIEGWNVCVYVRE
uniref:Putative secreted protein n=1 Tax=Anopheles darlingi TaxID=43151 RepID=A0A2M4DNC1_ANODA